SSSPRRRRYGLPLREGQSLCRVCGATGIPVGVTIVHFCPRADWEAALRAGVYETESLRTEGFIHFSAPEQVHLPANAIARGRTDLVLLEVDERRLAEPPRWEPGDPSDPDSMTFPHV